MKQTIKTFAFALALTAASSATFAQSHQQNGNRPSREAMTEQRANSIAKQMGLDEKTTKKFVSVYKSQQSEMQKLLPQRGGRPEGRGHVQGQQPQGECPQNGQCPQGNPPAMNGNGCNGRPQMSSEDKQKMEKVKTKYDKKYAKFFSQEQITQMYKLQEQERANHQRGGRRQ